MRAAITTLSFLAAFVARISGGAGDGVPDVLVPGLARTVLPLATRAVVEAAPVVAPPAPPRRLVLEKPVGGERLEVEPFDASGTPDTGAFEAIARFFRPRSGNEVPIDPRLVDLLVRISEQAEGRPIVLVSGHREPGRGTSKKSFHVSGKAADISIRGVGVQELRKIALAAGARGVGLYPQFVHVDVRDVPYRWVGGRWPRRR